jgi:thymidylate synthase (FAD)
MEIIKPSVEIWRQGDAIMEHIARCARVCYASDKTTNNVELFKRLIDNKHLSMLRHATYYFIIPYRDYSIDGLEKFIENPYIDWDVEDFKNIYVVTNAQFMYEHPNFHNRYIKYEVSESVFAESDFARNLMRFTFKIITQISTSRELNRVSPNNIAEQSTRYVNFNKKGGTLCQPHWITDAEVETWKNGTSDSNKAYLYLGSCEQAFEDYNYLIKDDVLPQDARGILPLDTATICIYTYSIKEWKHIIDLRYYGKTGKPHPNAKIIAGMIKKQLNELGYNI